MARTLKQSSHWDVTQTVVVADPRPVERAVSKILRQRFPHIDLQPLKVAFATFTHLYTGALTGYCGCDTWYHDARHSLDCALVMARLLEGHEGSVTKGQRLGARRALVGVIAALFHDAGYIRKETDEAANGAEFTLFHVGRSGDFLSEFLPGIGYAPEAPMIEQLVHFTGYEIDLDRIKVEGDLDRKLGFLLGTADILAQVSDRCYLEKCHDCLYPEFEICGLAGSLREQAPSPIYESREALVLKSPQFLEQVWKERMDGYFEGLYRLAAEYFGGPNHYLTEVDKHRRKLDQMVACGEIGGVLGRRVECINAGPLRVLLGLEATSPTLLEAAKPPGPRRFC